MNLSKAVNAAYNESDAYIDPDERFILFCSDRPKGLGKKSLYISFQTNERQWTQAVNLGDIISTEAAEYCPSVSLDSKHLFFYASRLERWRYLLSQCKSD